MNLKVNEIFYSLQGEGRHTGKPAIFVRLSGCNMNCKFCDTDWVLGDQYTLEEILIQISDLPCKHIVWTGGEPLLQLNKESIQFFKKAGFTQSVETNGTLPIIKGLDYVACSPKVGVDALNKNFKHYDVDEFRFVIGRINRKEYKPISIGQLPLAIDYYVSPLFDGELHERLQADKDNIEKAVLFVKRNPKWKLSIQTHKLLGLQ